MTAYIIALHLSTKDPEELAIYKQKGAAAAGNQKLRALFGRCEALEGPPVEGVVLAEFETYEEARAWYFSPAYQEAKAHRVKGADYQFILFEGV